MILRDLPTRSLDGESSHADAMLFDCTVVRQKRKTLALHVKHRQVEVRVPHRVSQREVQAFVQLNRDWIEKRLRVEAERDGLKLRIEHGSTVLYQARELTIRFRTALSEAVYIEDTELVIQGRALDSARASKAHERFLQAQARDYIIPRARGLAAHLQLEDRLSDIQFRKTKTKWGHCTSTGVLQYNWLIMLAPFSVIDYMIAHEVCHLQHMNHSRDFWELVDSVCPDSKRFIAWLKEHEHRLFF